MNADMLKRYFPDLTELQLEQFNQLVPLYEEWNAKINVVSRKDIDQLMIRHVLHSLGIAKVMPFLPGSSVLDIGTGGGFPGIPLAILFPEVRFTLMDSIQKKITVVQGVADALQLKNVQAIAGRAETFPGKVDFIVSRAVTQMPKFLAWTKGKFKSKSIHEFHNGILYLKGGDLTEELAGIPHELFPLKDHFADDFFNEKFVVYISRK